MIATDNLYRSCDLTRLLRRPDYRKDAAINVPRIVPRSITCMATISEKNGLDLDKSKSVVIHRVAVRRFSVRTGFVQPKVII